MPERHDTTFYCMDLDPENLADLVRDIELHRHGRGRLMAIVDPTQGIVGYGIGTSASSMVATLNNGRRSRT